MKSKYYITALFILSSLLLWTACSDSSTGNIPDDLTGESVTYELIPANDSSIDGKVTFDERVDGDVQVAIELNGLEEEEEYRVGVYNNSAIEEGGLLIDLKSVEGSAGESNLIITVDEDGESITYDDLLESNAHIRVYLSGDTDTILAHADIGGNALTGESLELELEEVDESGVSGEIRFHERENGTVLAVIELSGISGAESPIAHLHEAESDADLFIFEPVDSETGISRSQMAELEDGTPFGFDDLDELHAHIKVFPSESDDTVLARADLGSADEE